MNTLTLNVHNEEPLELEIIERTSSSTSQIQGKHKPLNIFESDSDSDDPFYNTNSSLTMPNFSLITSIVCLPLTWKLTMIFYL